MTFYKLFDGFTYHLTFDHTKSKPRADGKSQVKYEKEPRAPTEAEYEAHLRGERPIARSPLRDDCSVVWGAIDVDIYGADEKVEAALKKALLGTTGILFRTKSRGFHFIMFSEPVAASKMRAALELIRSRFPKRIRDKSDEIFPKQTSLVGIEAPSVMNLPCFGSTREVVAIFHEDKQGAGKAMDGGDPRHIFDFAYKSMRFSKAEIDDLAAKNEDRLTRGRPVEQSSPVGFKEPRNAAGRQEHLFKVGSSMRARGAEMDEIETQLFDLDKHYAEIGHPLWEKKKGRIEEKRIRSALKQIAKFAKGTPSGLHYDQVAAFNKDYAILDIDGTIEFLDVTSDVLRTYTMSHFKTKTATRGVKIGNRNVPIADLWIVDADRREYDGIVIEPASYDGNKFNLHRGFDVTPKQGDPSLFLNYIRNILCDGDMELARWVEHYLADMVQRPTEPSPPTAIVIRGPQGQGKSFLFRFMKRIMGPSAQEIADSERLFSRFNREIAGVTLIGAEEAIFSGDSRLAQILKTFISSHEWMYEAKHKATVTMKNVHRLIATTNSEHAALIDRDDRRLTIIAIKKRWDLTTPEGTREANSYWQPYYDFMDGDGPAIVLHHLLSVDVDQDLIRFGHIT